MVIVLCDRLFSYHFPFLQAFLEYFGPGNPKPFPNPYVFILFKQTKKDITVDPKYKSQGSAFNLGEFIRVYQLTGKFYNIFSFTSVEYTGPGTCTVNSEKFALV